VTDRNRQQDVLAYIALETAWIGFHHEAINLALGLNDIYKHRALRNIVHDMTTEDRILNILREMVERGYGFHAKEMAEMIEVKEIRTKADSTIEIAAAKEEMKRKASIPDFED